MEIADIKGVKLSTGLLVRDAEERFVFLVSEPENWERVGELSVAAFGGIGGKVRLGETPLEAVRREIYEETRGGEWEIFEESTPPRVYSQAGMALAWDEAVCLSDFQRYPKFVLVNQGETPANSRIIYIYTAEYHGHVKPAHPHPALIHISRDTLAMLGCYPHFSMSLEELVTRGETFSYQEGSFNFEVKDGKGIGLKAIGTAKLLATLLNDPASEHQFD